MTSAHAVPVIDDAELVSILRGSSQGAVDFNVDDPRGHELVGLLLVLTAASDGLETIAHELTNLLGRGKSLSDIVNHLGQVVGVDWFARHSKNLSVS